MSDGSTVNRMLSTKQAAALLGIGESTLEKFRVFGGGPKYAKLGTSRRARVIYDPEDLRRWLDDRKRKNTSQKSNEAA